jgi:hypothetical protein
MIKEVTLEAAEQGKKVQVKRQPSSPDGSGRDQLYLYINKVQHGSADVTDGDDVFRLAQKLQFEIDDVAGTNSMVHDYYRILQQMSDF